MEEIDIWRAAGTLVKLHGGEHAATTAALRADELLDQGDIAGFSVWKKIVKAINELERSNPISGDLIN